MAKKNKNPAQRILIVDDHPMMRTGLAQLIGNEPDLKVTAEADNVKWSKEMRARFSGSMNYLGRKRRADGSPEYEATYEINASLDISLPDKNGLELIKDLRSLRPEMPILVVSMHDEMIYAERVLRAGGRGYIMKQEGGQKFLTAIRQVLAGHIFVSENMSASILEIFSGRRSESSGSPVQHLSDREFEVFQLVGQGVGTRAIAEHLRLSVRRWRSTAPTSRRSSAWRTRPGTTPASAPT